MKGTAEQDIRDPHESLLHQILPFLLLPQHPQTYGYYPILPPLSVHVVSHQKPGRRLGTVLMCHVPRLLLCTVFLADEAEGKCMLPAHVQHLLPFSIPE